MPILHPRRTKHNSGRQVILTPPVLQVCKGSEPGYTGNSEIACTSDAEVNVSKGRDLVKNCTSTFLLVVKPVEGGSHIGGKWLPQFDDLPAPTSTTSF